MEHGVFTVAMLALALCAVAQTEQTLPVTRVVLFRSGVGYIERVGTVEGNAALTLMLREPQMNDLLKSLVLIDLDGGRIQPVQYTPRDPLSRTLASYAINIADNPSRAELLQRLRGIPVELRLNRAMEGAEVTVQKETSSPPSNPPAEWQLPRYIFTIRGTILSVESQTVRIGEPLDKKPEQREEYFLNLLTEQGVQTVPLSFVASFRLLDERLQRELTSALQTLASGLDNTRKAVELRFEGKGRRRVLVGYLMEMPLWKMTYRLVLPEEGEPLLQGWAIVENTTDEDWHNVQVSLVSGRPISFIQNLYEPFYLRRPVIRPPVEEWLLPFVPEAEYPAEAGKGVGGAAADFARAPARKAAPGAPPVPELGESMEAMQRSVQEMAVGQERGALFEYRIQIPVSIARQQSAMLPVINQNVQAEPVSLYNPSRHAVHPFFSVRLTNTTDLTLMEGPVTVYYGDSYGGDALMDTVEPKGERILTYALDTGVEVARELQDMQTKILTLKIVKGVLHQQVKQQRINRYTLNNRDRRARLVLVEQPYEGEWKLVEPSRAERTRSFYRFRVQVAPHKTATLQTLEERIIEQRYALLNTDDDTIQVLLRNAQASEAVRRALEEIIHRRKQIAELPPAIRNQQEQIQAIERDQERIRANMRELDRASDLYKQYVQKLTQQERELEEARRAIAGLQKQLQDAQRALTEYIQNLAIE